MPWALVVEPVEADRTLIVFGLTSAGFRVAAADGFSEARVRLVTQAPTVLVTTVRLGAFNGLQLVLRGRSIRPDMTVLVTADPADTLLRPEVEAAGATFVSKPLQTPELLAALYRTALRQPRPDGTLEPVRPPFERRSRERRRGAAGTLEQDRRRAERRHASIAQAFSPSA